MGKSLPIGVDNFEKIITKGNCYIDKTLFIEQIAKYSMAVNGNGGAISSPFVVFLQHFPVFETLIDNRWKEGDGMYDYDTCSESVLVKRARKKDVRAFSKLYENVYKDLYYFALYMMKNPQDAEDAVSETVLSAYENIHSLRKEDAFRNWIFKILSNVCKRKLKAKDKWEAFELQEGRNENQSISHSSQEETMDVQNAWATLTEEERQVIALSVFGGYNSKEIGQMLADGGEPMNANTVRSKRSRALRKLEKRLR